MKASGRVRNRADQILIFALVGTASAGDGGNITTIGTRTDGSAIHVWLDSQQPVPASRPHVLVVGKMEFAAWGRGNGFPALGLALTLARWPKSIPGREEVLGYFREHLTALSRHQDADGTWHQVIDHPTSYREFSATCMIAHAIAIGVHRGWLEATAYGPRVSRAWDSVKLRIDLRGEGFIDVCTGTGKQRTLEDYFRRTAILGRDDRGGAFALLLATELDR